MKKAILFILFTVFAYSQELVFNDALSLYEYKYSVGELSKDHFFKKFNELNYESVIEYDDELIAEGFFSSSITGFIVKIKYTVFIKFSTGATNIRFSKFVLNDHNQVPSPLEDIPYTKKKWIKRINEKLPSLIRSLQ